MVDLYKLLIKNKNIQLNLKREFINHLKNEIFHKYRSLRKYHKLRRGDINYVTLKSLFNFCRFYSVDKITKIMKDFDLNQELLLNNIISFRFHGSHIETELPRFLEIDNKFVHGFSLYIAEGDTGLNGKTRPQKLRLTNSDLTIIDFFRDWIIKYFNQDIKDITYYIYIPMSEDISYDKYQKLLNSKNIHVYHDKSVTVPKYRVCIERKAIIDIFFKLRKIVKQLVINNKELSQYYLKGIYDGEGTAYCKNLKYVRIEMKNKKEMNFLSKLLNNLQINHIFSQRNTRKGMYTIYISKEDNINEFSSLVGFELTPKRQEILDKIVNYYKIDFPYHKRVS